MVGGRKWFRPVRFSETSGQGWKHEKNLELRAQDGVVEKAAFVMGPQDVGEERSMSLAASCSGIQVGLLQEFCLLGPVKARMAKSSCLPAKPLGADELPG